MTRVISCRPLITGLAPPRLVRSVNNDDINHPLLGDNPTLKLMPNPEDIKGFGGPAAGEAEGGESSVDMQAGPI